MKDHLFRQPLYPCRALGCRTFAFLLVPRMPGMTSVTFTNVMCRCFFPFCHRLIPFPGLYTNDRTHISIVELEFIEHRYVFFILRDSLYPFIALLAPQIGRCDKRAYPLLFLLLFLFPLPDN